MDGFRKYDVSIYWSIEASCVVLINVNECGFYFFIFAWPRLVVVLQTSSCNGLCSKVTIPVREVLFFTPSLRLVEENAFTLVGIIQFH